MDDSRYFFNLTISSRGSGQSRPDSGTLYFRLAAVSIRAISLILGFLAWIHLLWRKIHVYIRPVQYR